ncbi:MAG: ammonium transporter, partial [Rubrobacteraceae bacterium]|nr:ammonium transporter [Rubrobacteraceae bacterium]
MDYVPSVLTPFKRRKLLRKLALLSTAVLLLVLALPGLALAQDGPSTADLSLAMDTMWVIIAACLVLFMQAGFAMLEVGFSRMKNVGSVVAKILVNLAIAALLFWAVGFALAFGTGNAIIGTQGWFLAVSPGQVNDVYAGLSWTQVPLSAKFLFQVAFCAVSLA